MLYRNRQSIIRINRSTPLRFNITEEYQHGLQLIRLADQQTGCSVAVLPQFGAALHEWIIPLEEGPINIIDNYPDKNILDREFSKSYKSAKLSPFVCRTAGGRYHWNGQDYEFPNKFFDGSAIHGLLFNKPFTVTSRQIQDDGASVELSYHYQADDPGYPFHYQCKITYSLQAGMQLRVTTLITNCDQQPIPVADGWHPYFSLGGHIDTWLLQLDARELFEFDTRLIPTGAFLPAGEHRTPSPIGTAFYDNSFMLNFSENRPAATLFNPKNKLKLSCYPDKSYPILQIFTPAERTSIAIENLSSAPDCLNNGISLITLLPRQTHSFTARFGVELMMLPEPDRTDRLPV